MLALINRALHTSGNLTSLVFWGFCAINVIVLVSGVGSLFSNSRVGRVQAKMPNRPRLSVGGLAYHVLNR
ncbi:MAG: hypothetical protein NPIRA01_02730 [Nitrospirales bacterium]|nr:MAG: hypothetical protein NPIRA01_02730 [Nitrospirales bacterium]